MMEGEKKKIKKKKKKKDKSIHRLQSEIMLETP